MLNIFGCISDFFSYVFNDGGNGIKPGSVLRHTRLAYDHYCIYAGNGQVIHFSEGVIKQSTLVEMAGCSADVVDVMGFKFDAIKDIPLELSLQRARSCLGMTNYDLLTNNCEHFAIWCRTGKPISSQAFNSESEAYAAFNAYTDFVSVPGLISMINRALSGISVSRTVAIDSVYDI